MRFSSRLLFARGRATLRGWIDLLSRLRAAAPNWAAFRFSGGGAALLPTPVFTNTHADPANAQFDKSRAGAGLPDPVAGRHGKPVARTPLSKRHDDAVGARAQAFDPPLVLLFSLLGSH